MKQFVPAMIGIGVFMLVVVGLLLANMPDDNPQETYDITIDGSILGPEPRSLETPAGVTVGTVRVVERDDGNTVLEFSQVLSSVVVDSSEVYLSKSDEVLEEGILFNGITIGEFIVDVTSEQLEEYQYVVIYDSEVEEVLAAANLE